MMKLSEILSERLRLWSPVKLVDLDLWQRMSLDQEIKFAKLESENAELKRDFIGVHQLSQDVISLAEEIRKNRPQGKMVKRWVLEARARGFSKRMLCERREVDALLADTQESE